MLDSCSCWTRGSWPSVQIILCLLLLSRQSCYADSKTWETYSAICVVAKNENLYVAEWIQYHRCLGIGKIYLYDHNSTVPMVNSIQSFVQDNYVEYIPFDGDHTRWKATEGFADNLSKFTATIQGKAYQDCLERYSSRHAFIGFIDVDEFMVLYDETVPDVNSLLSFMPWRLLQLASQRPIGPGTNHALRRYESFAGVSFYWVLLGSGGHKSTPPDLVTRSYLKCLPRNSKPNTQFKTFVNTAFRPTMYSPHRAMFQVNETYSFLVDENKKQIAAGRNKNSSHAVAAIYHYVTKSQQDFDIKVNRGGGAGVTRSHTYIRVLDLGCKETCFEAALQYTRTCNAALTDETRQALRYGSVEQRQLLTQLEVLNNKMQPADQPPKEGLLTASHFRRQPSSL